MPSREVVLLEWDFREEPTRSNGRPEGLERLAKSWSAATLCLLAERERKDLDTRIEEFYLKGVVLYSPLLPYELIEPRLPNFARAVRAAIDSVIVTRRPPIQTHLETNGAAALRWTQHHVQVA